MYMKWWTENLLIKRTKFKPFLTVLLTLALITSSGCSLLPNEDEEEVLPAITPPKLSKKPEYVVKTETLETKVHGIGKLMSLEEETLFFTTDNKRIKEVYVKSGDQVEAGQLIAELDVADLERDLRQKRLRFRQDELLMIETLRKANEMEAAELEQAKIDFELKRTELVELEEQIDQAKLKAPFAGTVVYVSYQKGDMVRAYDPVAVVADLTQLTAAAKINAEDIKQVAVGMEAVVDINSIGQHKGKVKQLPVEKNNDNNNGGGYDPNDQGNQKNNDSIDGYLIVELDDFPPDMNRGTPLSVTIIAQRKENATVIPLAALRSHGGRNYVQVVDDEGNKREVDVEIGQKTSTSVEIVKSLTPGQKVVGN